MADLVTLVILVAAGEATSPGTSAMAQGARDAFPGTTAEVHATRGVPTDTDALGAEEASHADVAAEVIWRDADHRRATLRIHLRQTARWIERSFTFAASDPAAERGRTLGFAVAAILPEVAAGPGGAAPVPAPPTASAPASTPASAPAPAPAAVPAPAPAGAPTPAPAPGPASAPALAPASAPASTTAQTSTSTTAIASEQSAALDAGRVPRLGLDLVGEAAIGVGSSASTAGGGGAIEWFLHPRFSLRLGAVARAGTLGAAQTHMSVVTSAGVVLHPWQPTRSEPFAVTIRVDYVLVRESATHLDFDDPGPVDAARWMSGVDTFLDGQLLLSSQIAAVAGIGVEDVWAPTYVYVRDERVATLPALRAVAEAGFQLRF